MRKSIIVSVSCALTITLLIFLLFFFFNNKNNVDITRSEGSYSETAFDMKKYIEFGEQYANEVNLNDENIVFTVNNIPVHVKTIRSYIIVSKFGLLMDSEISSLQSNITSYEGINYNEENLKARQQFEKNLTDPNYFKNLFVKSRIIQEDAKKHNLPEISLEEAISDAKRQFDILAEEDNNPNAAIMNSAFNNLFKGMGITLDEYIEDYVAPSTQASSLSDNHYKWFYENLNDDEKNDAKALYDKYVEGLIKKANVVDYIDIATIIK